MQRGQGEGADKESEERQHLSTSVLSLASYPMNPKHSIAPAPSSPIPRVSHTFVDSLMFNEVR